MGEVYKYKGLEKLKKFLYEDCRPPYGEVEMWQYIITGWYDQNRIIPCSLDNIQDKKIKIELIKKANEEINKIKIDPKRIKDIKILVSPIILPNSEKAENILEKKLLALGWIKWAGYVCKRISEYGNKAKVYVYLALELV